MRDTSVSWQKVLAQGFSCSKDLLEFLELPKAFDSMAAEKQFKVRVPRGFVARMKPGNPRDPLLLQVLATAQEMEVKNDYVIDPLEERNANPLQGLIHKYQGRVLLTLTGVCAINCRYCFRRHFPYQENNPGRDGWQAALDYIRQDTSIHEVILSGGDPLLAADSVLSQLITQLEDIAHLRTLRFHTRIPIVLPERINESLLAIFAASRFRKVMVLHCNHAQEIDEQVKDVCKTLRATGCHLLNQSVLLKGVNDTVQTLADLSEKLFDCGVLPYYLHVLDKVAGAAHFDIPIEDALELYRQLQMGVPGYLLPRLAREEPGRASKTLLI
jgi:L-lysine 2,3-aminomutase